jgi:ABC-type lipoprotein release transport system permease subunit
MGEATATGVIGGALGVALGYGGASLVNALAPALTASAGQGAGPAGESAVPAATASEPVTIQLHAPVAPSVIMVAVTLTITGGLAAGAFGGWRAARLHPAAALSQVA